MKVLNKGTIAKRHLKIQLQLAKVTSELEALRAECEHTFATKVARSNTGNYDPSANRYWYEFKCDDCGKFWHEDQ